MIETNKNIRQKQKENSKEGKISFRDDLKNLTKRYYILKGYTIKEKEGLLEIYESQKNFPTFKFVFDRKSSLIHPEADLLTFNSKKLTDIINLIIEKGKIAKAYIPFEFEPSKSFSSSIEKLVGKSNQNSNNYIINGNIESLGHYISYVPFLIFLVKIELASIETFTIIEKPVIPLIKSNSEIKIDEKFYINKIKDYFNTDNPNLTSNMPIEGEILDINEKDFRKIVNNTVKEIEISINVQKEKMRGQMNERLRKEHEILENYYNQRIYEIQNQIDSAKERGKKEEIEDLKKSIHDIENEKDFKKNEYETIYQLQTNYEILGVALIYIPALFYFKCRISSPFGTKEMNLKYDIFDNEIIAPKCACGESIYQGKICQNLHLSCLKCSFTCNECNKQICRYCDIKFCKECNASLCADHYYECESCKSKGINDIWVCKNHLNHCENCETSLCPECLVLCAICEKKLCKFNRECSFECPSCHNYVCFDHTFICTFDNKQYCVDEAQVCSLCHQTYCLTHFTTKGICRTCSQSSNEKFYKFLKNKKVKLNLPSEINISKDESLVKRKIRRNTYSIPYNQIKFSMGENKNYFIFLIKTLRDTYTIIHNKNSDEEKLYRKPNFIGKLINLISRSKLEEEIKIIVPIVSFQSKTTKKVRIKPKSLPKCPQCNKTFSEDYKICPYCGLKLEK